MFDMKKNSGSNDGYQLKIHYNLKQNTYYLTGYIVRLSPNNRITLDQDGAALPFNSLEAAIQHIIDYK